jgi:hypothetical protein
MTVHSHKAWRFIYSPNPCIPSVYMRYKICRPAVFETSWQCPIHSFNGHVFITDTELRQMWQYTTFISVNTDGKMSALSLMPPIKCKPRNCGSILHVSKWFINHFSEVSSSTLGNTQPPFQRLPKIVHRSGRTVKLTIHTQLVSSLRMRAAVSPVSLSLHGVHGDIFTLIFYTVIFPAEL